MPSHPNRLIGISEDECRCIFEAEYCQQAVVTFDNIEVRFQRQDFRHSFYESVTAKDDTFSAVRAERVHWIKWALMNSDAELYFGWDNKRKRYDEMRRVVIVNADYVVVIRLLSPTRASFVTAYVADGWTISRIRLGQQWIRKNR